MLEASAPAKVAFLRLVLQCGIFPESSTLPEALPGPQGSSVWKLRAGTGRSPLLPVLAGVAARVSLKTMGREAPSHPLSGRGPGRERCGFLGAEAKVCGSDARSRTRGQEPPQCACAV